MVEERSGSSRGARALALASRVIPAILKTMLRLFSAERPLAFFGIVASVLAASAVTLAIPVLITYLDTGLVPRFPTAILASAMMLLAALSGFAGLILDTVTRGRREMKMLAYLQQPISPTSVAAEQSADRSVTHLDVIAAG